MKILVIFTGGTIGSSEGRKWISLDKSTSFTLLENYKKENGLDVDFEVETPYSILSENLSSEELTSLCKLVGERAKGEYDGIIVTHGTDTIQYTAAALAYTVDTKIPVVLVSANYPLENPMSNGNSNFKGAVDFISKGAQKGVFVAYKNKDSEFVDVHLATSLVGHLEGRDEIFGLEEKPFAQVSDGEILGGKTPIIYNVLKRDVEFCSSPSVLVINSRPGDNFDYDLENTNAVLIKPYHSGTLNTANQALKEFCKKAKEKGVPVFLANVYGGSTYESSKTYKELGLTVLPFSAIPAIYVKIWIAISLGEDIKKFVLNELAGEFIK